ncbi:MAG: hypothetical protein EOP56_10205 [Sphingobacteriales bacterium]|nr:MAG: hypothetical protein EOP56_10205 [Sphingobacteriales bacterium]
MEKRYNVFNQIHKGLRGMMYDVAIAIQRTDFTSGGAGATMAQLQRVLELFDDHAEHEDKYLLMHILKHDQKLTEEFERDHVIDHKLAAELNEHIAAWKNAGNAEDKLLAGNRIFYAYNEFVAFNLYHMNKEEEVLLYTLWKHYTDEEIIGMQMQIIQSIAPETLMEENMWMMRSLNNPEVIGWLQAVKHTAPASAFDGLLQMAEQILPANRFSSIKTAVQLNPEVV